MGYGYPAIEKYMKDHNMSLRQFSLRCGITPGVLCRVMLGKTEPLKTTIDRVLAETGMSYEECFKEK